MAWISPVYDRTAADIANRTSKAFFNVADWQRIYDNSLIVRNLVNSTYGLSVAFTTLTAPTTASIAGAAEINSLVQNIELARAASGLPIAIGLAALRYDWAEGVNAPAPDYEDVNDWERDLDLIYNNLARAVDYAVHAGTRTVGQARFWQNGFR